MPEGRRTEFTSAGGVPTRWGPIDQLVGLAAFHGLTVLPTVVDAPVDGTACAATASAHPIPRKPGPYAAFMKALVQRYGPHGSYLDQPAGAGPAHPPVADLERAEPAVVLADEVLPRTLRDALEGGARRDQERPTRGAQVVLGGLPNFSWTDLTRIYRVKGARNAFDVIAVHPYTKNPQGVISILRLVRGVTFGNHQGKKPIIADEVSWPSSKGKTNQNGKLDFVTTEAGQAHNLGMLINLLAQDRESLGLGGFDYYTWAEVERPNARSRSTTPAC